MHEIIHVVDPTTSSSAVNRNLEVEAVDGRPLSTGYYFVLWSTRKSASKKRGKHYFGPLHVPSHARLLLTSALMLGLAEDGERRQAIAECRSSVRHATAANDCLPSQQRRMAC
jgi:hypothetical protein